MYHEITDHEFTRMVNGLLQRTKLVALRARDGDFEYVERPDGTTYSMYHTYWHLTHHPADSGRFARVVLTPETVARLQRDCDAEYAAAISQEHLEHPILAFPEGGIADGNHRALRHHQMGAKYVPAFQVLPHIWKASRVDASKVRQHLESLTTSEVSR